MAKKRKVFLDNSSTTPVPKEVVAAMLPYFWKKFGNPSSLHYVGVDAAETLEEARATIASCINAEPEEMVFTGGGTESDNLAIFGTAHALKGKGNHIITSEVEHSAVLNAFKRLEKEGFRATYLKVDGQGFIDFEGLKRQIGRDTILVSIIHGNHEIGTIQDIAAIGRLCRERGVVFHTDACQSFGKTELDVKKQNLDLVTLNAHKIHGPKGIGALYIRKGLTLEKIGEGGPQESNIRPGTENIPSIVGFAKAAGIAMRDYDKNVKYVSKLQARLAKGLMSIKDTLWNGPPLGAGRIPNNVNVTFKYIEGEAILMRLSMEGICVSTGSACSSRSLQPSHILTAIGRKHEEAHGSLRFSLSKFNTIEDIDYTIRKVKEVVADLRRMSSIIPGKHSHEELMKKGGHGL